MVIVKCSVAVPPQRIVIIQVMFALNLHCGKYVLSRVVLVRISDDNNKTEIKWSKQPSNVWLLAIPLIKLFALQIRKSIPTEPSDLSSLDSNFVVLYHKRNGVSFRDRVG